MYHYVRDLPRTRYPQIKGLLTEHFDGQLDYIQKHYNVCSFAQVLEATRGGDTLPPNPCLLTFDDGFIDHYVTVFPRLLDRKITAGFYPPSQTTEEHKMLDVHKVHFILASGHDPAELIKEIFALLKPRRETYNLPTDDELYRTLATASRFDPAEVIFIKRILQKGLPEDLRNQLVDELFRKYVSSDEASFACELYMDLPQLKCMAQAGMEIGGHGRKHVWLETLPEADQKDEIDHTVQFLTSIYGRKLSSWVMSYPYGSYNETTIKLLNQVDCHIGLTSKVALVTDLSRPMELERLDTNDLPKSGQAEINTWTQKSRQ
jgi:peptidoglycan/xylan/chitin deacetylase (PgdA/CDA1 family)